MSCANVGIGIDLVAIPRIERLLQRWGMRFLERVYTKSEIEYCLRRPAPAEALAARFAAKEAFFKALATSQLPKVTHRTIEVVLTETGLPALEVKGAAREALGERYATLSISHDGEYAIAMVLLLPEVQS